MRPRYGQKANAAEPDLQTPPPQGSCMAFNSRSTAVIATYIDEFIMLCAGLWMTFVGFGYLSLSRNLARKSPVVRHFKWMGPLLLLIAIILAGAS
jgi:hypothetical protein